MSTCTGCVYFRNRMATTGAVRGECRYLPPAPVMVQDISGYPRLEARYPPVSDRTPACSKWVN